MSVVKNSFADLSVFGDFKNMNFKKINKYSFKQKNIVLLLVDQIFNFKICPNNYGTSVILYKK